MADYNEESPLMVQETLQAWVMNKVEEWSDHYEANYAEKNDEYYRIWRGIWSSEDKTRNSERSRIIAPATQQAVESNVAEIEEATFGRGKYFDIHDDYTDEEKGDIKYLRDKLLEDFKKAKIRKDAGECLINAAVFGTGIAEVVMEEIKEMSPATEPLLGGELQAVGVNVKDRILVRLKPVMPRNFRIDPNATTVDDAMGVAIDEFVSSHSVELLQEQGVYRDEYIGKAASDFNLEPDAELSVYSDDKVRLTKYYGLVPTYLLEEEVDVELDDDLKDSQYVEAVVIIANEGVLLKAEANPYMMRDRPVVAFPWDVVPSRFYGRGVVEKGYNSQKALDAELRARIDALALTVHPMLAMDATRIPRGTKPEVRAGKLLLTNGDPKEIINPFNFGNVNQITFAQAAALQDMVQQSTGAVDSTGIGGAINGEATAAGISMSLGAIIKRHKRTLVNFQENFLVPFVEKAAYRYMQFEPELYPVKDYKFCATSSLGIMAREYEVTQLVQLLQTMGQDQNYYPILLKSIVDNMNLSERETLVAAIDQASQPDQQEQQRAQEVHQKQIEFQQSQINALQGQGEESKARAIKLMVEAQAVPVELELDKIKAVTTNLDDGSKDDKEFERRLQLADRILKDRELELKYNQTQGQPNGNATPTGGSSQPSESELQGFDTSDRGAGGSIRQPTGL
jgi:hypothetical protein